MQKQAFRKNLNKNKMMKAAAKVASRTQNQEVATNIMHDAADGKILKKDANKLVKESKVDPARFRCYYTKHLPNMCQDHLNGKPRFDSMQAFVEASK